jgi:hypothetical protein
MILTFEQLKRVRRRLLKSQSTLQNVQKHTYKQERAIMDIIDLKTGSYEQHIPLIKNKKADLPLVALHDIFEKK